MKFAAAAGSGGVVLGLLGGCQAFVAPAAPGTAFMKTRLSFCHSVVHAPLLTRTLQRRYLGISSERGVQVATPEYAQDFCLC